MSDNPEVVNIVSPGIVNVASDDHDHHVRDHHDHHARDSRYEREVREAEIDRLLREIAEIRAMMAEQEQYQIIMRDEINRLMNMLGSIFQLLREAVAVLDDDEIARNR